MRRRSFLLLTGGVALGVVTASGFRARAVEPKELVVFAATSLREVFQEMADSFEKAHAGVKVRLSFAGSQELRVQIEHGAKADVFASADSKHMQALQAQKLAGDARSFARNEPVLIVPVANPAKLERFVDLPIAERIVVGVPEVPIGAYTETILANAEALYGADFRKKVVAHIRSRELNVRQVLTKVALGEADAGVVYKTDALSGKDKVITIEIPDRVNVIADYPIAVLATAPHPDLAKQWVAAAIGAQSQQVLRRAGFRPGGDVVAGPAKR